MYDIELLHNSKTHLIDKESIKNLTLIQEDLLKCFNKRLIHRPKYLMEVAVLKDMKFPTPDAKYWQSVLERDIQFQQLVLLSFDYREKLIDIKIKECEVEKLEEKKYKIIKSNDRKNSNSN